jgi:protein-tyrosine-phosphatase
MEPRSLLPSSPQYRRRPFALAQLTAGLVQERRSSADARDVYYSLDLKRLHELYLAAGEAVHPGMSSVSAPMEAKDAAQARGRNRVRVLFLCTHNSARSQLAEGILRQLGGDRVKVHSAGSEPSAVHPDAIRVLTSLGIDPSTHQAKHLNQYCNQTFDYIITVCDRVRESCPVFPEDPERIHWSFPDPALVEDDAARYRAFEQTANQLVTRIRFLLILLGRESRR